MFSLNDDTQKLAQTAEPSKFGGRRGSVSNQK